MERSYGVLGAGRQGLAAALDLARFGGATKVVFADRDLDLARAAACRLDVLAGCRVGEATVLDAGDGKALRRVLEPLDAALSALPYELNPAAARAAVATRTHLADLGGNTSISAQVLALDAEARAAGVTLVPDCGLAPGLSATLVALALLELPSARAVRVRCGGLPETPVGPLRYQLVFAAAGLVNEYLGEAEVLRGGETRHVPALSEPETIELPPPFGACEAFATSGGTSTLPATYLGRLTDLDYKTVRYPGHLAGVALLRDLGLMDSSPLELAGGERVRPRDVLVAALVRALPADGPDLVVLRVEADGERDGRPVTLRLQVIDRFDPATGLTAMQRMTGFPAAMVVAALARGEAAPGARPLETALPPRPLAEALAERGLALTSNWLPGGA